MLATKSILSVFVFLCISGFLLVQGSKVVLDEIINGKHIVVPYYEDGVTQYSIEQRQLSLNTWSNLEKLIVGAVKHILVDKKSYITLSGMPLKLYSLMKNSFSNEKELIRAGKAHKEKDTWFPDCLETYQDVKSTSKKASVKEHFDKELSNMSRVEQEKKIYEDFERFMSIFGKIIEHSPVGTYLEWRSLTIDGVPVSLEAAYYYRYFKDNGFSNALWLTDQAVGRLGGLVG